MAVKKAQQIEFYYDDPIKALWAQKHLGLSFKEPVYPEDCCEVTMDFQQGMRIAVKMQDRFWLSETDIWKLDNLPDDKKRALKLLELGPKVEEADSEEEESR